MPDEIARDDVDSVSNHPFRHASIATTVITETMNDYQLGPRLRDVGLPAMNESDQSTSNVVHSTFVDHNHAQLGGQRKRTSHASYSGNLPIGRHQGNPNFGWQ
jgi:hypothetical protein